MEEINRRHSSCLKGHLSSMGRNCRWNIVSKCPELQSTKTYFPPTPNATQPRLLVLSVKPPNQGSILCWSKNWQSLHPGSWFVTIHTLFSRSKFFIYLKTFFLCTVFLFPICKTWV